LHAFAVIGHSIAPRNAALIGGLAHQCSLVPTDFSRASLFAMILSVNVRGERT